jgi:hypothetical protein
MHISGGWSHLFTDTSKPVANYGALTEEEVAVSDVGELEGKGQAVVAVIAQVQQSLGETRLVHARVTHHHVATIKADP